MANTAPPKPNLTRKEMELLELLESNPGRCFSRSFLLRRVWGYQEGTRTRTVDVHVSRLRRKLEQRRDVAIHTIVGQGYVLERRRAGERTTLRLRTDPPETPHPAAA